MAFVAADWSITRATGNIRYIGDAHAGASPSYVTTIELHRALQDFADDANDTGDDELSIIDETPSDRGGADTNITLQNGYNLDDASAEHVYDGSITQDGGATIYDGIQVFGNASSIQVVQNGALVTPAFWNEANMTAVTADPVSSTTHRFTIKVREAGADIDGRRLLGTQRVLGTAYTEFFIGGGTNRGNNVLALTANADGNNQTAAGTIAGWVSIVNQNEGYIGIDADGNGNDEFYYSNWTVGTQTKNDLYERAKWIQREGTVETLYGLSGDLFRGITHEIAIDTPTGTFVEPEQVTWTGGSGQLLAIDSPTAGTIMWIQLLTGQVPVNNTLITGTTSSATALVNVTVTARLLASTFVGASTGAAINPGAFGLGIDSTDLTQSDLLRDLTDTSRQPPNNVTFTVSNLVAGDRVLVGPEDGIGGLDLDQNTVNGTLSGAAVTSIVVTLAIPLDTPSSGTLRVQNDEGRYIRVPYSSYTGSTFTIPAYDFSGTGINDSVTTGNNIWISYIDTTTATTTESFTGVYQVDRNLFVRVRNSTIPIKTFESVGTLGAGGGGTTTGRTLDS